MPTTTYVPIESYTVSGTSTTEIVFGSGGTIPQTYTDLVIVCNVQTTTATDDINIQFNGDTSSSNYSFTQFFGNGSSPYTAQTTGANKHRIADYMPDATLFEYARLCREEEHRQAIKFDGEYR